MDSLNPVGMVDQSVAAAADRLRAFRGELYGCLGRRADELFELTDALLCTEGPVCSLVGLCLAPEHRRGHGALYDAINVGQVDVERLREVLACLPLSRMFGGRIVLAVDATSWLRPDAETSPERLFCHVYGRTRETDQLLPGWPYQLVAALESGPTSWTALLDAVRLGPAEAARRGPAGPGRGRPRGHRRPAARGGGPTACGRALVAGRSADAGGPRRRLRRVPAGVPAGRSADSADRADPGRPGHAHRRCPTAGRRAAADRPAPPARGGDDAGRSGQLARAEYPDDE